MRGRQLTLVQAAAFPFPTGQGSQVYVRGMARALARRGHRVIVACYGHGLGPSDPEYEVVRTPRVPGYDRMRAGPDLVKPWLDMALAAVLARLARSADLIHAHNYEAPLAAYAARLLTGCPVVYNNHNTMGEELHRYFKSRTARGLARGLAWGLDRSVPRLANAAVAISEEAEGVLREVGCREVSHVPPGVDMDDLKGARPEAARRKHGLKGRPWVVYAGNPDSYQDLEHLVDAVALSRDLGLLMVSHSAMPALQERASGIPEERKRFVKTPSWEETRSLIAAADVAAIPRTRCSGYPIKLLNFLGLGLPVVCARGSARDLPGVLRVENGDIVGLHASLEALCADPVGRAALGEQARQHVEENCDWQARARELERVYARLL